MPALTDQLATTIGFIAHPNVTHRFDPLKIGLAHEIHAIYKGNQTAVIFAEVETPSSVFPLERNRTGAESVWQRGGAKRGTGYPENGD